MKQLPMLGDILAQPATLLTVLQRQTGEGSPALQEAGRLLRSCTGKVHLSGMGASFFASIPAATVMERKGINVRLSESADLFHFGQDLWKPGDVAVLVSRSGGSVEVLRLAERMRADGIPIIAITNVPQSDLASLSDVAVQVGSAPDQIVAVQTYTATLLLLLLLAEQGSVAPALPFSELCYNSLPVFADFVAATAKASEPWGRHFTGNHVVYLLGRGDAKATTAEGALLFHETAKLPALPMSSGQFRHGPVEAITRNVPVIMVGTPEATRDLDWTLALDLQAMGARVAWVGPPRTLPPPMEVLGSWPQNLPASLAPLFAIVPLQLAAYSAALAHGVTPGDFRYAPEITQSESGFPRFAASTR